MANRVESDLCCTAQLRLLANSKSTTKPLLGEVGRIGARDIPRKHMRRTIVGKSKKDVEALVRSHQAAGMIPLTGQSLLTLRGVVQPPASRKESIKRKLLKSRHSATIQHSTNINLTHNSSLLFFNQPLEVTNSSLT